ncbi:hypothetical protein [Lacipirellula sp.]|uniref:hypothetical protein n=1 Tax=Lacipirellula sp. TaxID=2691419 RepID=UPI003D0EAB1B
MKQTIVEFLDRIGHPVAIVARKPVDDRAPPMQVLWPVDQTDRIDQIEWLAEQYNAVYCNLNPLQERYLSVRPKHGSSVKDVMIARRSRLLIDIDGHGVPLDEAERQKDAVKAHLGWPVLIETFTGNGYGLIYETDLPTDRASNKQVKDFLHGLNEQFNCVDVSCSNSGRLTRLIGTWNVRDGVRIPTRILGNDWIKPTRGNDAGQTESEVA